MLRGTLGASFAVQRGRFSAGKLGAGVGRAGKQAPSPTKAACGPGRRVILCVLLCSVFVALRVPLCQARQGRRRGASCNPMGAGEGWFCVLSLCLGRHQRHPPLLNRDWLSYIAKPGGGWGREGAAQVETRQENQEQRLESSRGGELGDYENCTQWLSFRCFILPH